MKGEVRLTSGGVRVRMIICAMREDSDNFPAPRRGVRPAFDAEETKTERGVFVLLPIIVVVRCPGAMDLC